MNKKSLGAKPLLYPEPCLLLGTYDAEGKANIMTAAWGGICNSDPLCLMTGVGSTHHTHAALLLRKAFTVSIPSERLLGAADYAGIVSGRRYDKFAATGLTPVRSSLVDAPYVGECPVVLECRLLRSLELGSHTAVIGEILDVKAEVSCLEPGGAFPDPLLVRPLIYDAGSGGYYGIGQALGKAFSAGKVFLPERERREARG